MKCVQCGGRTQNLLCRTCTRTLDDMLAELSWLCSELEVTATRQDRLTTGAPRCFAHPSPANIEAFDLIRTTAARLREVVGVLAPQMPAADPRMLIAYLRANLGGLAGSEGVERHYRTIQDLVGLYGRGPLHDAINRPDRRLAGPCPECQKMCHARTDDRYTTCESCGVVFDVDKNRDRALTEHDRMPERVLLDTLDRFGEHVSRVKFYSWVTSGKLPALGYLGADGKISAHRNRRRDPRVYSLHRVLVLRRQSLAPR